MLIFLKTVADYSRRNKLLANQAKSLSRLEYRENQYNLSAIWSFELPESLSNV